ncbi:MAG: hypothetical protein ABIB47_02185 [Candidatus Woesearchaeota archaeon]
MTESKLKDLKKEYKKLQDKYNLPSFEQLNQDFHIEKVAEVETEILIREIRKFIADKLANYLRFIETLLNPMNAPMFVFSVMKSISVDDKGKLTKSYKRLAKNEVKLIKIDLEFSEEKEAEFVKESYRIWQEIKKDLSEIVEAIEQNWDNKFEVNGKGYLG